MNFVKILRTSFLHNTSGRLPLDFFIVGASQVALKRLDQTSYILGTV